MKHYLSILLTLVLTACGGGGGGGSGGQTYGNPILVPDPVPFYTPVLAGAIQTTVAATNKASVTDIFTADLTGTGKDNVIIAGRLTGSQAADWVDSKVSVFGWQNGKLVDQTSQWFTGTDNVIKGTEPSVKFGDFLGNGKTGMYVAPSTDNSVDPGPGVVYINNGNSFTRVNLNLGANTWAHDSAVFDFNRDGKADIFNADYNGHPNLNISNGDGTFTTYMYRNTLGPSGAGVGVADFLGNGTSTIILTDTSGAKNDPNHLFSWATNGNELVLTDLGALPKGRFDLPQYSYLYNPNDPAANNKVRMTHSIRVLPFDFDNSGVMSAVVMQSLWTSGPAKSAVQFLKNNGSGVFTDVTDTTLIGYNMNTMASYNPKLVDINNDGLVDIFLSGANSDAAATTVLIHTKEHKYVASYANIFTAFQDQATNIQAANTWAKGAGNAINIVQGPNNDFYAVTLVDFKQNGLAQKAVYLSKLGTQTPTVQATVSAIKQAWPYMSDAQVNEVLSRSSTNWLGFNVVDPDTALKPYGKLSMPLNSGQIVAINGFINGVNLPSFASQVQVFDQLNRAFTVNLQSSNSQLANYWNTNTEIVDQHQVTSRGEYLISANVNTVGTMRLGQDAKGFTIGTPAITFGKNWQFNSQHTQLPFNPWVQFGGMYGQVTRSATTEFVTTYKQDKWSGQLGLLYTATEINKGLVNKVNNITGAWAEVGYRDLDKKGNGFGVYAGVTPVILSGSVEANLPTSVDSSGKVIYTNTKMNIQNRVNNYVRAMYTKEYRKNINYSVGGMVLDNGQFRLQTIGRLFF